MHACTPHHLCAWYPQRPEKGIGPLELQLQAFVSCLMWGLGTNHQGMLLTAKQCLSSPAVNS